MQDLRSARLAWVLFFAILACWVLAAVALGQSVLAVQHSSHLLNLGALNGALLEGGAWWRVLSSQFLHVHAPHMFFNALAILAIGAQLERAVGHWWLAGIYVVGGCIGQLASVLFYPHLVSSGASQALMALCAAALFMIRARVACVMILSILAIQLALDLRAAGTVKAGHGWGFAAGALMGCVGLLIIRRNNAAFPKPAEE